MEKHHLICYFSGEQVEEKLQTVLTFISFHYCHSPISETTAINQPLKSQERRALRDKKFMKCMQHD